MLLRRYFHNEKEKVINGLSQIRAFISFISLLLPSSLLFPFMHYFFSFISKLFPTFCLTSFYAMRACSILFNAFLINLKSAYHILCGIRFIGNSIEDAVLPITECWTTWSNDWHNFIWLVSFCFHWKRQINKEVSWNRQNK